MAHLKVKRTCSDLAENAQSYDMKVEITEASDMPSEVFVFKRSLPLLPPPGTEGAVTQAPDIFISVADPVDLEEYPVGAPDQSGTNPYFRLSSVDLKFRSVVDLNETWQYIIEDLTGLVAAVNAPLQPGTIEETTIG